MKLNAPLISVVIPHLNQAEELDHCLASLAAQRLERTRFEVIVVDNGSSLPPYAVVGRRPGTQLLHEKQPGPGPARNTGIQHSSGKVLALIDADCRADPDWLRNAMHALESSQEETILGGDIRIWRDDPKAFRAIEAYESVFAYRFKLYIEQHGFSGTGNLVVRRSSFEKIGPFAGINFAEDMDWGRRACRAGFRFRYVPEMIVFHPARRTLHELYMKWDRQIQHAINTARDQPRWRIRWVVRALAVLGSPAIDFAKVLSSERIHGAGARFKAILILVAIRAHRARKMLSLMRKSKAVIWNRNVDA
ncbi:glycosyltransferase [Nitrobacter sp. TKz-YC02]|uniref:glycosyltransferase n=1 Tax=Nitrobacter sp. TKz-YC02 TaxID=3398704 RepID=UPI003CEFDC2F